MKQAMKNTLSVAGADAASRVLGFAVTAYLGRVLGTAGFGSMNIGLSVLGYALLVSSPGLQVIGTRDVAGEPVGLREYASGLLSLRLVLASAFVLCTALVCIVIPGEPELRLVIALFTGSALPAALSLDWFFQGRERLETVSAGRVIMYVAYLLAVVLLVSSAGDVAWSAVAYFFGVLCSSLWMIAMFRTRVGNLPQFVWAVDRWKSLLRDGLPLGFSSLLAQSIINLPVLIVGVLLSTAQTGLFSAAMKLIFFVLIIDRVFYSVYLPVISRTRDDRDKFGEVAALGLKLVLAVAVPVAALGAVYARDIIALIYGQGYVDSALLLQILCAFVVFTLVNTVAMGALVAAKREREYLNVMAAGTAVIALLCVVLTQGGGIAGTALSLVIGEAGMSVAFVMKLHRMLPRGVSRIPLPPVLAGAFMLAVLMLLQHLSPAVTVPASLLTFLAVLFAAGGLSRSDIIYLRQRFV